MNAIKPAQEITWDDVEILIIGAGTMGASLTQAYSQSGFNVGLLDISGEILERASDAIDRELRAGKERDFYSDTQVSGMRSRIIMTTSHEVACRGKNLKLVIETATENIEIKKNIFRTLDNLCSPGVIFASNSSSLDTNLLARETKRPDRVVWMHYFYLPHKNRAGEYAGTETASPESIALAAKYMKLAGKVATPILSSRKGGAADVIFVSLLLEAARMIDDGFDIPSVEAAGKKAFNMPVGFLELMDSTGIPLGIYIMYSFSDSSYPEDPFFKVYGNFFSPPESYKKLFERYKKVKDKSSVRWVTDKEKAREPEDLMVVDKLKERFLATGFMTAVECVNAGVIELQEVDRLCQNAFLWRDGPFALMNKIGINEVMRIITEKLILSHSKEINFPIPQLLISQVQKNEPWPISLSPVVFSREKEEKVARIMISDPQTANALDTRVFEYLKTSFRKANEDENVEVILFDTAPIKTFISGADVSNFVRNIKQDNFLGIKKDTAVWQDVLFHEMTCGPKPKIAIVDGAALGGGAEVALAYALDPGSLVLITDRTSYSFPETRLGIYPGLRGTLTLPQIIHKATNDAELAVALSRYYILSGGAPVSSPRILKYLGIADFLVPARKRDEVVEILAQSIIDNAGNPLTREQMDSLKIEELPLEITTQEEEELGWMKELFLKGDLIPSLYAYGRGQAEVFLSEESRSHVEKVARRLAGNSPHAVCVANLLISEGFAGYLKGKNLDELAQWELDRYLEQTFQHPDALEGLSALIERRTPEFDSKYTL